ncbi:MAG: radical SAM protein [Candidatus Portnoybacteria bacterium]|nr:radical SAM protein [Candidatus Portnoybacteria bacterium]
MKENNKIKKTVIIIGYQCNNRCQFCNDANKRELPNKTTRQIKKEMIEAKNRGTTYLELIGGETTIRPDAVELVKFAKDLGFKTINMATNGRMFSYLEFTKKIIKAGLTDIIFSIHGHNSKIHDYLTQSPGSFKQLLKGLDNFKKLGFKKIGSNTTIVKQNYKHLPQIGQFIYQQGIRNSEFIFVDPNYGGAYDNFDKLVPRISQIAPYVKKCLDIGKKNKIPHWDIRYVPLCYFQDYLDQVSELREVKIFHTEHLAPDFENFDVENSRQSIGRIKTKKCQNCKLFKQCEGIWQEYYKHYGDEELKPIKNNGYLSLG